MTPPAACTALALNTEYGLVASGTAHGFTLFDYIQKKEVLSRCTLEPGTAADAGTPKRKNFRKSLRESFRRLRKVRLRKPPAEGEGEEKKTEKKKKDKKEEKKEEKVRLVRNIERVHNSTVMIRSH